jgi:D-aminoacyl-tRNA deacylase
VKAVLQRVSAASVSVGGQIIGAVDQNRGSGRAKGLMILLGVAAGDTDKDASYLAQKVVDLRIFPDDQGKMNKSLLEIGGSALIVSQFTLLAEWRKGRRPGFTRAAVPDEGKRLYLYFVEEVRRLGVPVQTGEFGAEMEVSLVNDGPVTLILENQFAVENKAAENKEVQG